MPNCPHCKYEINNPENVRPRLQLLIPEQINMIHLSSIKTLEATGIKVESKRALKIFEKSSNIMYWKNRLCAVGHGENYFTSEQTLVALSDLQTAHLFVHP